MSPADGATPTVEHVTWRYLPDGRVKHALRVTSAGVGPRTHSLCGMRPMVWVGPPGEWHGTGSQDEHDECARRPACKRCAIEVVSRPGTTPPPGAGADSPP